MKDFLIVRSVPLADDTRAAWAAAGGVFRRRGRPQVWDPTFHEPNIKAVINLGNLDIEFNDVPVPVFNPPDLIRAVSTPAAAKRTFGNLMPNANWNGPHWHKQPGMKGKGKLFHSKAQNFCTNMPGIIQEHVEGQEFRVVTVGSTTVQATKKLGKAPDFEFEWVGVKGIAKLGVIPLVKEAVARIPGGEYSVIGWDIIVSKTGSWIIEANTSPGVNEATALRIVDQIKEVL